MRAVAIIMTLTLLPILTWGQSKGLALGDTQLLQESYAYLERQLNLLEQDELISSSTAHSLREEWERYAHSPLDPRTASIEDLLSIPLMTEYRAYQLILYRQDKQNPLDELSDLKLVDGWDEDFVTYLYPLVRLGIKAEERPSLDRLLSEGKARASLLFTRPWSRELDSRVYVGSPERLDLKYLWQSRDKLSLFVGASKDNYEPWQYGRHRGFDSYHGHISLRNIGIIREAIIGQYRATWAEGLVLGQGFRYRSLLNQNSRQPYKIKANRGLGEYRLSQGLAVDLRLTQTLSLNALASWQRADALVDEEDGSFRALDEGGMHRSAYDYRRRHNLTARHWGLSLVYRTRLLSLSVQGIHYDWSGRSLSKALGASYHEGLRDIKSMSNASLAYQLSSPTARLSLSGEVATTSRKGMAQLHRLSWIDDRLGSVQLLARYIDADYWAYHGQTQTHYDRPHNEWGVGFALSPRAKSHRFRLHLEGDYYGSVAERGRQEKIKAYALRLIIEGALSQQVSYLGRTSLRGSDGGTYRWGVSLSSRYRSAYFDMEGRFEGLLARKASSLHKGYALIVRSSHRLGSSWHIFGSLLGHQVEDWSARIYYCPPRLSDEYLNSILRGRGLQISMGIKAQVNSALGLGLRLRHHRFADSQSPYTELALQLSYTKR